MAPPFKEALVDIIYGQGISQVGELVDMAADLDIINKAGSWYSYHEERIGQGRENAKQYLLDNPNLKDEIEGLVRQHFNMSGTSDSKENELLSDEVDEQTLLDI